MYIHFLELHDVKIKVLKLNAVYKVNAAKMITNLSIYLSIYIYIYLLLVKYIRIFFILPLTGLNSDCNSCSFSVQIDRRGKKNSRPLLVIYTIIYIIANAVSI